MIKTERLIIRPLHYYELVSRVYSKTGGITTDEEMNNVINFTLKPMAKVPEIHHKFYTFWVGEDNGEEVVEVGFLRPPDYRKGVEIWYQTLPKHQNKGYATEAVKGMIKVSKTYGIDFICASIDYDNIGSQRVAKKAGLNYHSDVNNMMAYYVLSE